ncbi:MAG: hypothetical protein QOF79_615 [Actinomycetota bacterium]|nr:hypothetical protein [Actinomycetota bacterium]
MTRRAELTTLGTGARALVRALLPNIMPAATEGGCRRQLAEGIPTPSLEQTWLVLAVLGRELPTSDEVEAARRLARHNGLGQLVAQLRARRRRPSKWFDRPATVVTDAVLLDIQESATSTLMTGVQRVARSVALEWLERDSVQLVGWSTSRTQLLRIDADAFEARRRRGLFRRGPIVPWGGTYVLAESLNEPARASRIQALAAYSGTRTGMIGNDAIPLTTAETTGPRMPGVFAKYLAAASRMNIVATISEAAATEYRGWKAMLSSAGIDGPDIVTVQLASTAQPAEPRFEVAARARMLVDDLPLVLCVGSHEPRKNHLAVLHAAELLWVAGHRFSLAFIGGNAWNSEEFDNEVSRLRAAGRPVQTISGLPDGELWWAYRLARLTVFPSLNEGFGLPVAESLGAGTPVVTSDFGSMAEIAEAGGCVLVDPRNDEAIAEGVRSLLVDEELHKRLAAEASARRPRSWAEYADDVWDAMVNYDGSP